MNKEEVARVLKSMRDKLGYVGLIAVDEERLMALEAAARYLLAPDTNDSRKDPVTVLVPCGCGGEVVRYGRNLFNRFTTGCSECGTLSWSEFSQEDADKNWNNSRGYRDL